MKLIIFDCDGTLVDSQHLICEAMTTAFAAGGLPVPSRPHMLRHVGLSLVEAMAGLSGLDDEKVVAQLAEEYRAAFTALRQEQRLAEPMYPGALDAIAALAGREGVRLGIATGKSRRGVDRLLEREALQGVFATIMTADDAPSKPHPAMIRQAMDAVGARPDETVMIGDTSFDMLMARAASARAIGVGWGYHPADELMESGAEAVAESFDELLRLLPRDKVIAAA